MLDPSVTNSPFRQDLDVQAFLYANGELDGTEAVRFERRLAEEQAAREALSEAVLLCQPPGTATAAPDPGYRERVRRRLQPTARTQPDIGQSRLGRSVIWALLGAAAVLLFLSVERTGENQQVQAQLHELTRETEQLKQELGQVEDELLKKREHNDKTVDKPDIPKK
jgi:anti-sigma-K factor RskA